MKVIQIVVDKGLEGNVGIRCALAAKRLVIADLPEDLAEVFNVVGFLQPIEGVEKEAELAVAVLGKLVASLITGLHTVEDIGEGGIIADAVIKESVVTGEEESLTVEDDAVAERNGEEEITHGLERNEILLFLHKEINVIAGQVNGKNITVTVKGGFLITHDERGIALAVKAFFRDKVKEGSIIGTVDKGIVVIKDHGVLFKIDLHGIAVFTGQGDNFTVIIDIQAVVGIIAEIFIRVEEGQKPGKIFNLDVREIVYSVNEVEGEGI